ncbi:unnamed protein product [Didymodactylos carnosus]|uniref:histone acetyltransferase n=1 Tax=Didymodactylos carnosus TaxID=1234261 RepID=A0A8S2F4Z1_9BILA|nr:unnamed protein product [Didymodactylos carnosus]CAF4200942.1 unnamed protein product [Didymodactylos carnosus]
MNYKQQDVFDLDDGYKVVKSEVTKTKNNESKIENTVKCINCGTKFHEACILFINDLWPNGFLCKKCTPIIPSHEPQHVYSVEILPTSKLSDFIQNGMREYFRLSENQLPERERALDFGDVYVRVVYSYDHTFDTKNNLKQLYSDELSRIHTYRCQVIFLFQKIDNISTILFGIYVQEYDEKQFGSNQK